LALLARPPSAIAAPFFSKRERIASLFVDRKLLHFRASTSPVALDFNPYFLRRLSGVSFDNPTITHVALAACRQSVHFILVRRSQDRLARRRASLVSFRATVHIRTSKRVQYGCYSVRRSSR